jgi:hypothetical protein
MYSAIDQQLLHQTILILLSARLPTRHGSDWTSRHRHRALMQTVAPTPECDLPAIAYDDQNQTLLRYRDHREMHGARILIKRDRSYHQDRPSVILDIPWIDGN